MLIILDGFGYSKSKNSPVNKANMVFFRQLWKNNPHRLLKASGTAVGLLPNQDGNSEVGHLILGSGRVIYQDVMRINNAIKNKSFFKNRVLIRAMKRKRLHLIGLLTDVGTHAHISHLFALLRMAKNMKVPEVYVHVFTDGRDVQPKTAIKYIRALGEKIKELGIGEIASVIGRYYAMDRDKRWERTKKAFELLVKGEGEKFKNPITAIRASYKKNITDEFIKPVILNEDGIIKKSDSVIFFNFRPDRARQLSKLFIENDFNLTCFTKYADYVKCFVFGPQVVKNTLAEVLEKNGKTQLRIAETEKYAHVTYFFNAGHPKFKKEKRILIPSPKVSTYDKKPEMSAKKITNRVIKEMHKYDFILVNFANPDMVGHTGNEKAIIKALEFLNKCLEKIIKKYNGIVIITSDHGNAEKHGTAHSASRVPLVLVGKNTRIRKNCSLANIAPTILTLMGIEKPKEMVEPFIQ